VVDKMDNVHMWWTTPLITLI